MPLQGSSSVKPAAQAHDQHIHTTQQCRFSIPYSAKPAAQAYDQHIRTYTQRSSAASASPTALNQQPKHTINTYTRNPLCKNTQRSLAHHSPLRALMHTRRRPVWMQRTPAVHTSSYTPAAHTSSAHQSAPEVHQLSTIGNPCQSQTHVKCRQPSGIHAGRLRCV